MIEIIEKLQAGEINFNEAKQLIAYHDFSRSGDEVPECEGHIFRNYIGKNVFIRTVTHHYTGRVVNVKDDFLQLIDAAWIADDGRFANAIASGTFEEVEPYPTGLIVNIGVGAVLDLCEFKHELPRVQK